MEITYQTFKIILGLIASVFILSFFIYYAGVYSQIQTDMQKVTVLKNFVKTAEDVYLSGNPIGFSDFQKIDMDMYLKSGPGVMEIISGMINMPVEIPFFFLPEKRKEYYIYRNEISYGWWKFYYILALPELDVVFNAQNSDDIARSAINGVASVFPSTLYTEPKIRLGFCDWEISALMDQYDFLGIIGSYQTMGNCSAQLSESQRLATISSGCGQNFPGIGVCISPIDESKGYVFLNNKTYIYKDFLDIAVLIIGSGKPSIYGDLAEILFDYKNKMFAKELAFASKALGLRALWIARGAGSECKPMHVRFAEELKNVEEFLSANPEYYKTGPDTSADIENLQNFLKESMEAYDNLVNSGCELP